MSIPHAPVPQADRNEAQQETAAEEHAKIEWLRQAIQVGLEDIENGRYAELTSPEEIDAHLAKVLA